MFTVLAFDPGTTGAVAALTLGAGNVVVKADVHDLPTRAIEGGKRARNAIDATRLSDLVRDILTRHDPLNVTDCVIEDVRLMPNADTASSGIASLMHSKGVIEGVIGSRPHVNVTFVDPQAWKRPFGLVGRISKTETAHDAKKRQKALAREIAVRLYPILEPMLRRVSDHNRAEAVLMAHYRLRELQV